ncbi:MAG: FecR domain-containing protein, partial [Aulosira sp. DedVER01a]
MLQKFLPLLVISVWGVIVLPFSERASSTTPLTRAEIQELRNLVQLIPRNGPKKRPARKSDAMIPGDGLSTGRASLADLRFNDGSLARVGEQAIFQFLPKTRNFRLTNGTVLLLIPPGRGQTRIQTPNAAAAIRGSALFVRYDEKTDTTIVGALTDSGIEVSNKQASQSQVLEAGQLMVIVKGKFQGLYDFDLRNFYETSDLVRDLDLTRQNVTPTPDPAIASVQAETATAVATQTPIKGEGVIENPSFLQLTATSSTSTSNENNNDESKKEENNNSTNNNNSSVDTKDTTVKDTLPVDTLVDTGQVQSNEQPVNNTNNVGVDTTQTSPKPQIPSLVDQPKNPNSSPDPASKPDGGGNPNPKPDGGGNPNPKPDGGGNPNPKPDGGGNPNPKPDGGGNPNPKPDGGGNPNPKPDGGGNPNPKPDGGGNPNPKPDGGGNPNPKPDGGGNPNPDPKPDGGGNPNPKPDGGGNPNPKPDG